MYLSIQRREWENGERYKSIGMGETGSTRKREGAEGREKEIEKDGYGKGVKC